MKILAVIALLSTVFQLGCAIRCWHCTKIAMDFSKTNLTPEEKERISKGIPVENNPTCNDESQSDDFITEECEGQCVTFAVNGTLTLPLGRERTASISTMGYARGCARANTIPAVLSGTCSDTNIEAMHNYTIANLGPKGAYMKTGIDSGKICFCTDDYCNGPRKDTVPTVPTPYNNSSGRNPLGMMGLLAPALIMVAAFKYSM